MTRRQRYFVKQKLIGVLALILAVVLTVLMDGDATICLLLVPLGLGLIFTKEMYLINKDYYILEYYEMLRKERRS